MVLKQPIALVSIFVGVIVFTLSMIVAGYFHGNMSIQAVCKSLNIFT